MSEADGVDMKEEAARVATPSPTTDLQLRLPLARIKRIAKSQKLNVRYISNDAAVMIAKATELFMEMLVREAYRQSKNDNKKIIKYDHLAMAVSGCSELSFLGYVVRPVEEAP